MPIPSRPVDGMRHARRAQPHGLRSWWPALFVVALTFAFRMNGLEYVRHNYDRAYPHGLGIFIREAIADGRLDQLPSLSLLASINLSNPAGASYFYALLTAVEPSAYVATALNAMLGAVVAAVAYGLTRRIFGTWAAFAAGLCASASLWAAWVARGSWLQGPIEAMSALALWLLVNGLTHRRLKHLFAGLAWIAACVQTYLVTFGLLAQGAAALLSAAPLSAAPLSAGVPAKMRRALLAGSVTCALSLMIYASAVIGARASLADVVNNPHAFNEETRAGGLNLDPINHVFRIASSRDFENTFVESDTPGYALRDRWSDGRATLVDALMLVGAAMLAVRSTKDGAARMALTWLMLPIAGTLLIANVVMRDWKVHVFYLLLTSPTPYMITGAPFALLEGGLRRASPALRFGALAPLAAGGALFVAIAWWNAYGDLEATVRFPYTHDGMYSLPLKWQMHLAGAWREQGCTALNAQEDERWLTSLLGSARPVRSQEWRVKGESSIWQVQPEGGNCVIALADAPAPAQAQVVIVPIPGLNRVGHAPLVMQIYRSLPIERARRPPDDALLVNLGEGWRLLEMDTPATAQAGQTITVTHQWLVGQPPNEPYWAWYFAPFVKLFAPDGQMLVQIDHAPAILGDRWRPGHVQVSAVRFVIPADLPAGEYQLEMSLFDPNQGKNAVYFDPAKPGQPIVTIRRELSIMGHSSPVAMHDR